MRHIADPNSVWFGGLRSCCLMFGLLLHHFSYVLCFLSLLLLPNRLRGGECIPLTVVFSFCLFPLGKLIGIDYEHVRFCALFLCSCHWLTLTCKLRRWVGRKVGTAIFFVHFLTHPYMTERGLLKNFLPQCPLSSPACVVAADHCILGVYM